MLSVLSLSGAKEEGGEGRGVPVPVRGTVSTNPGWCCTCVIALNPPMGGGQFPILRGENGRLQEPGLRSYSVAKLTFNFGLVPSPAVFCWNSLGRKPGKGHRSKDHPHPTPSMLPPQPIPFAALSAHFLVVVAITITVADSFPQCFLSGQNLESLALGAFRRRALWNSGHQFQITPSIYDAGPLQGTPL